MPSSNRFRDPDQRVADFDQFQIRLPHGMRDEIRAAAKDAGRSMNAEIIARLSDLDTVGLRDRFAGQALAGFTSGPDEMLPMEAGESIDAALARFWAVKARASYIVADAMLAAREARCLMRAELSQIPAVARLCWHLFAEPVACLLAVAVFVAVIALGTGGLV